MHDERRQSPEVAAFADESFNEDPVAGYYILAAAVVELEARDDARAAMHALLRRFRGRRASTGAKLHWNQLDGRQRRTRSVPVPDAPSHGTHSGSRPSPIDDGSRAAGARVATWEVHSVAAREVVALGGLHVVTVASPVPPRRQERARALCLRRLVVELHGLGVRRLCMEARAPELNARDVRTVAGARFLLPRGADFIVDHELGTRESTLWIADLIAGAMRAQRAGDSTGVTLLGGHVQEIEVSPGR